MRRLQRQHRVAFPAALPTAFPTSWRVLVLLGACLAVFSNGPAALPDDRLQAIEITAERAERNELEGYTVYSGAVILNQGSLHIEADRLTIFHDRVAADRIVAQGSPARLRQRPALDKPFVVASARRIVYERSRELVLLRDAASIEQDGAVVTGESIQYFMAEQRVRADATPSDESSRVQVFIPAEVVETAGEEKINDAAEAPEPPAAESSESDDKKAKRVDPGGP